jgi:hypothetical protein
MINFVNRISFGQLKFHEIDRVKIMKDCEVKDKNGKTLSLLKRQDIRLPDIRFELYDNKEIVGTNLYKLDRDDIITEFGLEVNPKYRKNGYGTLLKLLQIIHMLENNSKAIVTFPSTEVLNLNEKLKFDYDTCDYGIFMKLKNETVQQNKDYFNALFEKHGLDYKI